MSVFKKNVANPFDTIMHGTDSHPFDIYPNISCENGVNIFCCNIFFKLKLFYKVICCV